LICCKSSPSISARFQSEVLAMDSLIRVPTLRGKKLPFYLFFGCGFRSIIGRYWTWDRLSRLSERIFAPISRLICHYFGESCSCSFFYSRVLLDLCVAGNSDISTATVLLVCSLNCLNHQQKICCVFSPLYYCDFA